MAGKTGRKKNKQTNKKERKECVHVITVGIGLEKKKGGKRRRNGVHEQESEKNICIKNGRRHMTAGKM